MIGYIYKLTCSESGNVYYGSTTDPLRRYKQHQRVNNTCKSKELINPDIDLLECISIQDRDLFKKELLTLERKYIENNNCVNKNIPLRTNEERYRDIIKKNPNYQKEQYIKYGGKRRNERTKVFCDCGGKYIKRNKKMHLLSVKHNDYVMKNNIS